MGARKPAWEELDHGRTTLNGAFRHSILGFNREIEYGVPMSFNTWTIIAVDANGNESAPVSITTNNTGNFG